MTSFVFIVTSSVVSLVTVVVSCAMAARSLAVAVTRFAMASTVSYWRYSLSGFAMKLCTGRRGADIVLNQEAPLPVGGSKKHF